MITVMVLVMLQDGMHDQDAATVQREAGSDVSVTVNGGDHLQTGTW